MGDRRNRGLRGNSLVDAVHLSASVATVAAFLTAVIAAAVGFLNDVLLVALAVALGVSLLVNLFVLWRWQRATSDAPGPPFIPRSRAEKGAANRVMALLRDSLDAAVYDAEHGSAPSAAAARHAALSAVMEAEGVSDASVRMLVRDYRDELDATPAGWRQKAGANEKQVASLRAMHDAALSALGEIVRAD